ncbi:hypothetical protein UFOVP492_3 [uncultured Caudovirales phage]|uniref:Uncharacterized protein n=1 Tax=uncultured Caudovirales phage TaxID=2100421 RepID=A0A6J5MJS9_9CAUD|nr:hypothetical protein UFOVP492_3 [uncultured Caudovirales phage]
MRLLVPANPIKIYIRQGDITDGEYLASNVAFIIVENTSNSFDVIYVTISGTQVPSDHIAFARVLIDGQWVSHD